MHCFKTVLFPFLFVFLIGFAPICRESKSLQQTDLKQFLSNLPNEERYLLDFFFRCLIQDDAIGYVLLGGKPMAFYSCFQPKTIIDSAQISPHDKVALFFSSMDEEGALFRKGMEIWKKYESLFSGTNVFFDVYEQTDELHLIQVSVINKCLMLPLLRHHFDKFKKLNDSIEDEESLFQSLLQDYLFKEKFYNRDDLLGICLGYGENNAVLFQKMNDLRNCLEQHEFLPHKKSADRMQMLKAELSSVENVLRGRINPRKTRKFFFNIGLGFRANFSDPETIQLQRKYGELHKQLTREYDGRSFLERTLELICIADRAVY